jgi:tetratricopeptide (TPR) repeat protein
MVWDWFLEWRDRRSALRSLHDRQQIDEAILMDQNQNPLHLAMLSLSRNNPAETAMQWERAALLMPNAVVTAPESLEILLGLERYDEAEALIRKRAKRIKRDPFCYIGLARIAEQRGDVAEALKRWEVVRSRVTNTAEGFLGCARCLVILDRLEEADTQLNRAFSRDPDSHNVRVERARISDRRKDWEQSLERWKLQVEVHQDLPAFASVARALIELGRLDEAEDYLKEPSRLYPHILEIAIARAQLAQLRGDVAAACERWATVRRAAPFLPAGYQEGAARLVESGRNAEADAVLCAAIERFPDQEWPLRDRARLAHDPGD